MSTVLHQIFEFVAVPILAASPVIAANYIWHEYFILRPMIKEFENESAKRKEGHENRILMMTVDRYWRAHERLVRRGQNPDDYPIVGGIIQGRVLNPNAPKLEKS